MDDSDPSGTSSFLHNNPIVLNSFTMEAKGSSSSPSSSPTPTTTNTTIPFQVNLTSPITTTSSHENNIIRTEVDFFKDNNSNKVVVSASASVPENNNNNDHHHFPTPSLLEFKVNVSNPSLYFVYIITWFYEVQFFLMIILWVCVLAYESVIFLLIDWSESSHYQH